MTRRRPRFARPLFDPGDPLHLDLTMEEVVQQLDPGWAQWSPTAEPQPQRDDSPTPAEPARANEGAEHDSRRDLPKRRLVGVGSRADQGRA